MRNEEITGITKKIAITFSPGSITDDLLSGAAGSVKAKVEALKTVAMSGRYEDLTGLPVIGGAQLDWSGTTTYSQNAIVSLSGKLYRSAQNNNLNHSPATLSNLITWWVPYPNPADMSAWGTINAANINAAITALNAAGIKKLNIPSGIHGINDTIVLPANFALHLDNDAQLYMTADKAAVRIDEGCLVTGGTICYDGTANQVGILVNGDDIVKHARVQNIVIESYGYNGTAILFDSTNPAGNISNCYSMYCQFSNVIIKRHQYGIRSRTNVGSGGTSWANAHQFNNIQIYATLNPIVIERGCEGYVFLNTGIECQENTVRVVYVNGKLCKFTNITYWDKEAATPIVYFDTNSENNDFYLWYQGGTPTTNLGAASNRII